jgi:hypothetical protein
MTEESTHANQAPECGAGEPSGENSQARPPRVIYIPLLGAYPVLSLYAQNVDLIHSRSVIAPLILLPCGAVVLWLLIGLAIRNRPARGLITAVLLALTFGYGHLHEIVLTRVLEDKSRVQAYEIAVAEESDALHWPLLSGCIVLTLALIVIIVLARRRLNSITRIFNYAAIALAIMPLARIGLYHLRSPRPAAVASPTADSLQGSADGERSDIYYIVLDAYARKDVLQRIYGFDNSPFIEFLEERGFQVADRSRSNYSMTFLSLASSLNSRYVNYLRDSVGQFGVDRAIPYRMIQDNEVARILRRHGYRFVHFNSTWGATFSNPFADVEVDSGEGLFQNEFYRALVSTSLLKFWSNRVQLDLAKHHLTAFEKLKSMPELKGPKFVFAHFIPPHFPFLFDREGNVRWDGGFTDQFELHKHLWGEHELYVDQLVFVNRQMRLVVDAILSKSERPPIVIIQSDHGPAIRFDRFSTYVWARTANFIACHFPGGDGLLYDSITPVNLFRLIFNHYFGASLEMLEDRATFSDFETPYDFSIVPPDSEMIQGGTPSSSGSNSAQAGPTIRRITP